MGRSPRRLNELIGNLKDKTSLVKATLSKNPTITLAILCATTHKSTFPPPPHRLAAVLSLGRDSTRAACTCIAATLDRLHCTRSPYVALKCLILLHTIINNGSIVFQDNLPTHNSLNLSAFRNRNNLEARKLATWLRWYATILEANLSTSRLLGSSMSSISSKDAYKNIINYKLAAYSETDLLKQIECLVCMVEDVSKAPESLDFQKNDLIHEVMVMVSEDYRSCQYLIMVRVREVARRVARLSSGDSAELIGCLKRLEERKKRLTELFIRRKNDSFWELIGQTKAEVESVKEEMIKRRLLPWR